MPGLRDFLTTTGASNRVVIPTNIGVLIDALEFEPDAGQPPPGTSGELTGTVKLTQGGQQSPVPGVNLGLGLPTALAGDAPGIVRWDANGFKVWVVLAKASKLYFAFKPIESAPGAVFVPAKTVTGPDGLVTFVDDSANASVQIVSRSGTAADHLAPSLLIFGDASKPASMRFTPDTSKEDGIVPFGIEPSTVLIKGTSIGLEIGAIAFDDSDTAAAPDNGPASLKIPNDPTKDVAWRGIVCKNISLYLPTSVPLFGGRPIAMWFAASFGGGVNAIVDTVVPAIPASAGQEERKGFSAHIECVDPTAMGFAGLVPTLVAATMELPIKPTALPGSGPIDFMGGKPIRARLTLSRDPVNSADKMRIALAFDAQGPNGLIAVRNDTGATNPGHFFNVAAGLATSLIASGEAADGTVAKLALAGAAGSAFFKPKSEFILNAVELESSGHGLPIGGELRFSLDYSVALRVKKIGVDGLSVEMVDDQPMRFRIRRVALVYAEGGVGGFKLDYQHAEMEIENPGAWTLPDVGSLKDLLDVIGGRSGRGSMWVEVDLRFKLNLGPVQVSGITLRATKGTGNDISVSVTKMAASLSIPGALSGSGEVALGGKDGGFRAQLSAKIVPINVTADALVIYEPPMTVLGLGVDLPAPIPLANSGLGLFGISGLFGSNATPAYPIEADPVLQKLKWKPNGIESFKRSDGEAAFGFGAVIGTLPDMGTAFSAKASLLITVPDVMVRGSVNARAISPRVGIETTTEDGPGYSALGMFSVDKDAVAFAVIAKGNFAPLLTVQVPIAGYFDRNNGPNWYVYLGADGAGIEGRAIGPVSVKVLPGILDIGADAYLMTRGAGITNWPHGRAVPNGPWSVQGGFIVAFGFSVHSTFGPKPIAYAELNASLDLLLGTSPLTMAGFGSAGGSLHLGPFSVGVQASIAFRKQADLEYLWAEVVARIELLFTDIEGRVTISHGDGKGPVTIPEPVGHPLERLNDDQEVVGTTPALTDDTYRLLDYLSDKQDTAPVVWPDIIVSIPFNVMPEVALDSATQFPDAKAPSLSPPKLVGTEMLLYKWTLNRISLRDVTDAADKTDVNAGTELAKKFAASWQAPRAGATALSELVLGSHGSALFAKRLADGGESLDTNPTAAEARFCELIAQADAGWAIGAKALNAASGTRVPAEFVSNQLSQSLVQATARHYAEGQGTNYGTGGLPILNMDGQAPIPAPYRLAPKMLQIWDQRQTVRFDPPFEMKYEFGGHYWPPNLMVDSDATRYIAQVVELTLDEEIRAGQLLLLLPPELELRITSGETIWRYVVGEPSGIKSPAGEPMRFALAQAPLSNVFAKTIVIRRMIARTGRADSPSGFIGIVGLRGITRAADDATTARNKSTKEKEKALKKNATEQYKPDFVWDGEYLRTILEPGRLYRLDVGLSWSGTVFEQQADGTRKGVNTASGEKPKQFFFKTAPKPAGPASAPDKALMPSWARAAIMPPADLHLSVPEREALEQKRVQQSTAFIKSTRTDHFDAELVERYFGGYTPAQSELFRFTKDPLSAHFTQDHVVALAKAYGFDLELAFRRVDKAGSEYDQPSGLKMVFGPLVDQSVLSDAQRIVSKAMDSSPCVQPKPGMTGKANKDLEPRAWYELYVRAMQEKSGQRLQAGRFRGVTFRTSRWSDPKEMVKDVLTGKGPVDQPYIKGDLLVNESAVNALKAMTIYRDDRAFEAAAGALSAGGWPEATEPRVSWLWTASNAAEEDYRLVGVIVESPEPLVREQRADIGNAVDLDMGQTYSKANALTLCRSDRAACRFLFLATSSIQIRTVEFVQGNILAGGPVRKEIHPALIFKAKGSEEGDFTVSVPLEPQPSFAEADV